ncbi:MAG: glucosaminidase domain-containing protein [Bacteroidales bacterium]|nr:glucosaminidase domain-containing protein [Bacteroidales bacterium]MCM1147821.1 glucosaminidase domain-containing protein [Bacteroidales bacterium]MCM1206469.1 glucosaminidase domain-containing protein [Bacillota bacterium]MCM1510354.1 glucosaminidase domain-containing protein [Clostridium sp.]
MMRKVYLLIILVSISLHLLALPPVKWNQRYQSYIDKYKDIAIYEMLQYGIPASITLAQGVLESGAGGSELTRKGNNHFGIKCHDWTGPTTYHDDDESGECFRVYRSAFESYEDHSKFLGRSRYKRLFSLSRTDYKGWARGLKACGYATNPRYAQLLIDIIECYNLSSLDKAKSYNPANVKGCGTSVVTVGKVSSGKSSGSGTRHEVKMNNRNYYIIVRDGDTFKSIAKEFDISYRKLARYNERDRRDALYPGEIIYFEKKRTKADKKYKKRPHIVRAGESMYDISQKYGVRLKSLYKKNHMTPANTLHVGDRIKVY